MTEDNRTTSRRVFLTGAGAGAAAALTPTVRAEAAAKPGAPARSNKPVKPAAANYRAKIFPIVQSPAPSNQFPEQAIARYSASTGQWGVAFSGGGPRAFSAALGQMCGLQAAGVVDDIGAISCVSGGSWFGSAYTFAPSSYSDATLLGQVVPPAALTVDGLNQSPDNSLASLMENLSDEVLSVVVPVLVAEAYYGVIPYDKVYARSLNATLLSPLQIGDYSTGFTLNQMTAQAIQARNPSLTNFYTPRPSRPFFIAGGTEIYQPTAAKQTPVRKVDSTVQVLRNVEYTSLYTGAAPLVKQTGGQPYGGGFVESFAFDTPTPQSVSNNIVSVPPGAFPFILSDVIGSSSAAIEAALKKYLGTAGIFPQFSYWPITNVGNIPATTYAFGDGGILENTGVVSLLRRGYKTIFAFVNSPLPIGSNSDESVMGIDGQISRLFGFIPKQTLGNAQSTQVFAKSQYASVVTGLTKARDAKGPSVYANTFPVIDGNVFDIKPYSPKIFWIYNQKNLAWYDKLPSTVLQQFAISTNNLGNFPNYDTVFQNGADEPLYLTPLQVNLLAQMWAYTVKTGFSNFGYAFGYPVR